VDNASEILDNVQSKLNLMQGSTGGAVGGMQSLQTSTDGATSSISSMGNTVQETGANVLWTRSNILLLAGTVSMLAHDVMQYRTTEVALERAQYTHNVTVNSLADAQQRYNDALVKYGGGSVQATAAAQDLALAQERESVASDRLSLAQDRQNAMWVNFATQSPMIIGSILTIAKSADLALPSLSGIASALGLSGGAASSATGTFSGLASGFAEVGGATGGLTAGLGGLATTGAVVGAVIGGVADLGYKLYSIGSGINDVVQSGSKDWTQYAGVLLGTTGGIGDLLQQTGLIPASMNQGNQAVTVGLQGMQAGFTGLGSSISQSFTQIGPQLTSSMAGITAATSAIDQSISASLGGAVAGISGVIAGIGASAAGVGAAISSGIGGAFAGLAGIAQGAASGVTTAVNSIPTSHETAVSVIDNATGILEGIVSDIWSIVDRTVTITVNYVQAGLSWLGGILGGYQTGTPYVPETGPYLLHKGEMVIPANETSQGSSRMGQVATGPINTNLQINAAWQVDGRTLAQVVERRLIQQHRRSSY
jgi:hypothetical protein